MPTAGWWEALWPDPAGVLAAVGMRARHGRRRSLLRRRLVHAAHRQDRASRHGHRHRPDPLEVARHRLTESGATNCEFVAGDAYELARLVPGPPTSYSWRTPFTAFPIGRAWRVRCGRRSAGRPFRHRELAPATARGNGDPGRAARTKNRIADVAGTDHRGGRGGRPQVCPAGRTAALSPRRRVRTATCLSAIVPNAV